MDIRKSFFAGIKWTSSEVLIKTLLQIGQISLLSHYLNSSEYGLISIVTFFIGLSIVFADLGVSNAIIQKQNVSETQLNTLYWLNVINGIILFILFYIASKYIALYYEQPKLDFLLKFVSITFMIQAFGRQYRIILSKNLLFELTSKIEIFSQICFFLGILLPILLNIGINSYVFGYVFFSFINTLCYVLKGVRIHKPKFEFKFSEVKSFLSFGLFQMGEKVSNYFSREIDILIIGKVLGPDKLGIYAIFKNFLIKGYQAINPIITRISFPIFSIIQDDIIKLRNTYYKSLRILSTINFYLYAFLIIINFIIIKYLFGNNYLEYNKVFIYLSITFMIRSIGNPVSSVVLSRGYANLSFYWNILWVAISIPFFLIFSRFGIEWLSIAYIIFTSIHILLSYPFLIKPSISGKMSMFIKSFINPLFQVSLILFLIWIINLFNFEYPLSIILNISFFVLMMIFLNYKFNYFFFNEVLKLFKNIKYGN